MVGDEQRGLTDHDGRDRVCAGGVYPSLTIAGGHIFAAGQDGTLVVRLTADRKFHPVGFNTLGPMGGSMLVFSGRDLFVRAGSSVYRIRE